VLGEELAGAIYISAQRLD